MESLYIPRQQVLILCSFEEDRISNTEQFCLFQLQDKQSRWLLRKTRELQFTLKRPREHKMLFFLPLSTKTSASKSTGANHRAEDTKKACLGWAVLWTSWIKFLALPESGVPTWYSPIRKNPKTHTSVDLNSPRTVNAGAWIYHIYGRVLSLFQLRAIKTGFNFQTAIIISHIWL